MLGIYISIYIYILSSSTDCFCWCFKLGSKPAQLYVRLSILPLSHQSTNVSLGIITHYVLAFICLYFALPDTGMVSSLEELCITLVAAVNTFARVLNPQEGSIYIVFHRQTVSLYYIYIYMAIFSISYQYYRFIICIFIYEFVFWGVTNCVSVFKNIEQECSDKNHFIT